MGSGSSSQSSQLNVRLAAGVLLGLFIVAGTGLFGVQYSHQCNDESLGKMVELNMALNQARSAQVAFKIQVQEWKNTLLRGQNKEDFEKYHQRFLEQSARMVMDLGALKDAGIQPEQVSAILAEHEQLNAAYTAALAGYKQGDTGSIFRTDAIVRGQDRLLDTHIDKLAEDIAVSVDQTARQARLEGENRYRTMRNLVVIVSLVVIALAAVLAVRIRRQ